MADVYVNALTQISTEPTTTDSLVVVNRNTNEGKIIDYNLLADVILNKITSKQFSGLDTTSKLLVGAINELDGDIGSLNSNIGALKNTRIQVNSGASVTYTIQNTTEGLVLVAAGRHNNAAYNGMYFTFSSASASAITPIVSTSTLTVTISNGVITVTNNGSYTVWATFVEF